MEEIIENNKLIAKFMDWNINNNFPDKNRVWESPGGNIELDTTLKFHSDWNLLIPVIEKIESLDLKEWFYKWNDGEKTEYNFMNIEVTISYNHCYIDANLSLDPPHTLVNIFNTKTKLEATYQAVVEFIKWYNEKKKENDSTGI